MQTPCKRFTALSILMLAGLATGALAQTDADEADRLRVDFQSLDSSNDGYITRDELPVDHPIMARFEELDRNRDERLSPEELSDYR